MFKISFDGLIGTVKLIPHNPHQRIALPVAGFGSERGTGGTGLNLHINLL